MKVDIGSIIGSLFTRAMIGYEFVSDGKKFDNSNIVTLNSVDKGDRYTNIIDILKMSKDELMKVESFKDKLATKNDLVELENNLRRDMRELEYRIIIKLGGLMAASIAVVAALVKLL